MASELRVNSSTNRSGLGTITYTDSGPIISGVGTFTNGFTVDGTQTTVKSLKLTGDNYNANWFKTTNKLRFNDNAKTTFGTSDDLQIYHTGSHSYIADEGAGELIISGSRVQLMNAARSGKLLDSVEGASGYLRLYQNNNIRLETTSTGVTISGTAVAGALDISGDIDVDGHTNLDNTDIVGILTVTSTTQYGGYKLSNNSSIVGELVGLSGSNDTGALALWSGGSKYVQLSAVGNSFLKGGNFGLGDETPSNFTGYTNLSIHGSTGGAITFGDDGTDEWEIYAGDGVLKVYDRANTSERLRIDANGDLNLGNNPTNQYGYKLNIQDSAIIYAQTASSGGLEAKWHLDNSNQLMELGTVTTDDLSLVTTNIERLRITSGGQVQIKENAGASSDGASLKFYFGNNNATDVISSIYFANNSGQVASIKGQTRNGNNYGMISFHNQVNGVDGESMRLNHDGGFCVGTDSTRTAEFTTPDGFSVRSRDSAKGQFQVSVTNETCALLNKKGNNGQIIGFRKDGTGVGEIGVNASTMYLNFGGTTAAAHQLDDYEEGSWVPSLNSYGGGGSGGVFTYTARHGQFTKLGRYCT